MIANKKIYIDPSLKGYWDRYDAFTKELLAAGAPEGPSVQDYSVEDFETALETLLKNMPAKDAVHNEIVEQRDPNEALNRLVQQRDPNEDFNRLVDQRDPTTRVILDRMGVPATGAEIYAASVFGFKNSFLYTQLMETWVQAEVNGAIRDSNNEYTARLIALTNEIKAHLAIQRMAAKDKLMASVILENNQVLEKAVKAYETLKEETAVKQEHSKSDGQQKALEQFAESAALLSTDAVKFYVSAKNIPVRQNMMRNINAIIPGGANLTTSQMTIVDAALADITNAALLKLAEKQWNRENDPETKIALEKKKTMLKQSISAPASETGDFLPTHLPAPPGVDDHIDQMAPTLDQLVAHGEMNKGTKSIEGLILGKCLAGKLKENFQAKKSQMTSAESEVCSGFCEALENCNKPELGDMSFSELLKNSQQFDLDELSKLLPVFGAGLEAANQAEFERKEAEQAIRKLAEDLHGKENNIFKAGQEELDGKSQGLDITYTYTADDSEADEKKNLAGITNFFYNRIDEMGISAKGIAQLQQAMFVNASNETKLAAKTADAQINALMGLFQREELDNDGLLNAVRNYESLPMPDGMKFDFKRLKATYDEELLLLQDKKAKGELSDADFNNKMQELDGRYPNVQFSAPQYVHLALLRELHRRVDYAITGVLDPDVTPDKKIEHQKHLAKLSSVYQQAIANFMTVNKPRPENALSAPSYGQAGNQLAEMLTPQSVIQTRAALANLGVKLGVPRPAPKSSSDKKADELHAALTTGMPGKSRTPRPDPTTDL